VSQLSLAQEQKALIAVGADSKFKIRGSNALKEMDCVRSGPIALDETRPVKLELEVEPTQVYEALATEDP
jgi:hypothetical protein